MKYPLDKIVREYMVESLGAEQKDRRYPRLLQIAISGLRDLHRDSNNVGIKQVILSIQDNDTILLPDDYLNYRKVGLCLDGQILALGINNNMCPPSTDDCGNITLPTNSVARDGADRFHYFFDTTEGVLDRDFGAGAEASSAGYFKIFEDKGYIAIQESLFDISEVYLDYHADLDLVDGSFLVHPDLVEALKAWMWWKYIERQRSYPLSEKESARRTYGREKLKAAKRMNALNAPELVAAVKSAFMAAPKL